MEQKYAEIQQIISKSNYNIDHTTDEENAIT